MTATSATCRQTRRKPGTMPETSVLAVLNELFGYEGDDPIEGVRAVARYVTSMEMKQRRPVDGSGMWSVQINDLIGGYIVTDYPHPLSEHDHRRKGDPDKAGDIACECVSGSMAEAIALLLNENGTEYLDGR